MVFPFNEFIIKIASRCNLNCDYCYEYNLGDNSWHYQPKIMSLAVARQAAYRIREHLDSHDEPTVTVLFHGGEPTMVGLKHLRELVSEFRRQIEPEHRVYLGMQTNATLLTSELVDFLDDERFGVGISVDGPPEVNDVHRVDHIGRGSGAAVSAGLQLIKDRDCFSGILCVIDVTSDPLEVWNYLASFSPPTVDFLLPHGTWDRRPPLKKDAESTPYADWLIPIFDRWFDGEHSQVRIRYFEAIMKPLLGGRGCLESIGLEPAQLLVIAANGAYEGVDTLKAVIPGAHVLGMSVFRESLDEVLLHPKVVLRHGGTAVLSEKCQACEHVESCGGGYITHRYSEADDFKNPSVFCADIFKLTSHISDRLTKHIKDISREAFS